MPKNAEKIVCRADCSAPLKQITDIPRHECGIFGVFGHASAAQLSCYGLSALQHRGQESAGIVISEGLGHGFHVHRAAVKHMVENGRARAGFFAAGAPGLFDDVLS